MEKIIQKDNSFEVDKKFNVERKNFVEAFNLLTNMSEDFRNFVREDELPQERNL